CIYVQFFRSTYFGNVKDLLLLSRIQKIGRNVLLPLSFPLTFIVFSEKNMDGDIFSKQPFRSD
ncbi:hypothetical protein JTT08_11795, partial [Clostridium botulinum]|nr:hypothetical protein [Clostridium botulinum]